MEKNSRVVDLPSGAKLTITVSAFAVSRALYQAVLEEAKVLKLDPTDQINVNLKKDIFCAMLSSKKVEACLDECMKRVLYNGIKVTSDTWEPVEARDDYLKACFEVAKDNILPFTKSLYAEFAGVLETLAKDLG